MSIRSLQDFTTGKQTPLNFDWLPKWANPQKREENHHHVLRRLFETSDWVGIEVYGPEVLLQQSPKEVSVDILLHVKSPEEEFIGIEVKRAADAFERERENLEQLKAQADLKSLDRLYVCTPQTDEETRLDIDPTATQLIQQIEFTRNMSAFRGLEGTIQLPNGRELNKSAFYTRSKFQENPNKLIDRAKREGDWSQIKQNLDEIEYTSLIGGEEWVRGDEWIDDILNQIGVIRLDLDTGDVSVQDKITKRFRRTRIPARLRNGNNEIKESDVVHALWEHYIERPDTEVAAEIEPPSLTTYDEPDMIERFFGEQTTRSARRPDLLVATEDRLNKGIEVKGEDYDKDRLFNSQLPQYHNATELDKIAVALPNSEIDDVRHEFEAHPNVGLISVGEPRGDRHIEHLK